MKKRSFKDKVDALKKLRVQQKRLVESIRKELIGKTITTKFPRGRRKKLVSWVFPEKGFLAYDSEDGYLSLLPKNCKYYISLNDCFISDPDSNATPVEQTFKLDPMELLLKELKEED